MESTYERMTFYYYAGMPPREISDTLGIPLSSVYRNLQNSDNGRRTLHYFPQIDTSVSQLTRAEINRQYVQDHLHPSKE
jgi:hypothetical protein